MEVVVAAISAEAAASTAVAPMVEALEVVLTAADILADLMVWVPAALCAATNPPATVPPRLTPGLGRATLAPATPHPVSMDSPVRTAVKLQPAGLAAWPVAKAGT